MVEHTFNRRRGHSGKFAILSGKTTNSPICPELVMEIVAIETTARDSQYGFEYDGKIAGSMTDEHALCHVFNVCSTFPVDAVQYPIDQGVAPKYTC